MNGMVVATFAGMAGSYRMGNPMTAAIPIMVSTADPQGEKPLIKVN